MVFRSIPDLISVAYRLVSIYRKTSCFRSYSAIRIRIAKERNRNKQMTIKVLLVDDHSNVRQGLKKMLNRSPKIEVVGETGDGREVIQLIINLEPDVMLLDVEMPGMNGYEVARQVTDEGLPAKVLALSGHNEKRYILGMFASGAVGYLTKEEAPQHLVKAVNEIAAGKRGWISERVANILGVPPRPVGRDTIPALSDGEKMILQKSIKGKNDQEISAELNMKPDEIQKVTKTINMKLGVNSRMEAILRAMQEDII